MYLKIISKKKKKKECTPSFTILINKGNEIIMIRIKIEIPIYEVKS